MKGYLLKYIVHLFGSHKTGCDVSEEKSLPVFSSLYKVIAAVCLIITDYSPGYFLKYSELIILSSKFMLLYTNIIREVSL